MELNHPGPITVFRLPLRASSSPYPPGCLSGRRLHHLVVEDNEETSWTCADPPRGPTESRLDLYVRILSLGRQAGAWKHAFVRLRHQLQGYSPMLHFSSGLRQRRERLGPEEGYNVVVIAVRNYL